MTTTELLPLLQKHFGYGEFRPQQADIIQAALEQQDVVALMPTGGGKSLCFQMAGLAQDGTTLVVSPLISLMKDQVDGLTRNDIPAAYLNSAQTEEERSSVLEALAANQLKFLYTSPETLFSATGRALQQTPFNLVAIDEAHCVSMWGHDFRPEYTQLKNWREQLSDTPFMALTATADKLTRNDIIEHLGLKSPKVFISSFDRPNIHLAVRGKLSKQEKLSDLLSFIQNHKDESGIVYCLSRKETEEMAAFLKANGLRVSAYHAGLPTETRALVQDQFLKEELEIVCATIAFGMGIDKSNVRWVVHNNLPKNIEGYYQEIGRAGRDGLAADAVLYFNYRDVKLLSDFAQDSNQEAVLLEKLDRMVQYAEASRCRRKILLAYFSEHLTADCGHCDVCAQPSFQFDGTVHAQKAISAVLRAQEQLSTLLLIDVLRGAKTAEVYARGLNQLKTYGAGKDESWKDWSHFVTEMKNLGVFEIAYNEKMHLKVTPFGRSIVKGAASISLTKPVEKKVKTKRKAQVAQNLTPDQLLFDRLKLLRKKLAVEENVPPYLVFSDVSLKEMSATKPKSLEEFLQINGVGEVKMKKYGTRFLDVILEGKMLA